MNSIQNNQSDPPLTSHCCSDSPRFLASRAESNLQFLSFTSGQTGVGGGGIGKEWSCSAIAGDGCFGVAGVDGNPMEANSMIPITTAAERPMILNTEDFLSRIQAGVCTAILFVHESTSPSSE